MFFHGNGETLNSKWFLDYLEKFFPKHNILTFDYPGYAESRGLPTQKGIHWASELFYNRLITKKQIEAKNITLRWYSLGTSQEIHLASQKEFNALILISPFTSRHAMTEHFIGYIPQKYLLIKNSLNSLEKITHINKNSDNKDKKVLVVHGTEDTTIPYNMGAQIFEAANTENKQFITIEWWGHETLREYSNKLLEYYKHFLSDKVIRESRITIK